MGQHLGPSQNFDKDIFTDWKYNTRYNFRSLFMSVIHYHFVTHYIPRNHLNGLN